jgi:hypothetical protein
MEIDKDNIDVSDDNIFLQLLMEKHKIEAKQLAGWSGRKQTTIYKYLSGECTIPSIIWRTIFDHTLDVVVFNIIKGDIPCIMSTVSNEDFSVDSETLKQVLRMRKSQLKVEDLIVQILEDGRIDKSDFQVIANFELAFPEMINNQIKIHQAIINAKKKFEAANA